MARIGGLVGYNVGGSRIGSCYATGSVSGSSWIGGLVGRNNSSGSLISRSFWDKETSGTNNMCGSEVNGACGCEDDNGKMTSEMQQEKTFTDAGWDFVGIWNIGEAQTYSYLRVYPTGDINQDYIVNMLDFAILANHWLKDLK